MGSRVGSYYLSPSRVVLMGSPLNTTYRADLGAHLAVATPGGFRPPIRATKE